MPTVARRLFLYLIASLLSSPAIFAATLTWTGASTQDAAWSRPENWSPSAVPQNGDDLVFPAGVARRSGSADLTVSLASLTFSDSYSTSSDNQHQLSTSSLTIDDAGAAVTFDNVLMIFDAPASFSIGANILQISYPSRVGLQAPLDVTAPGGQLRLGTLSGSGNITMRGGTLSLVTSDYTGTIDAPSVDFVSNGGSGPTIACSLPSPTANSLAAKGRLADVTVSGTLSTSTTITNNLTLAGTGVSDPTGGPAAVYQTTLDLYNYLSVGGQLTLSNVDLSLAAGSLPAGQNFTLVTSTLPVQGTFNGLPEGAVVAVGSNYYQITYAAASGHNIELHWAGSTGSRTWSGNVDDLWSNPANWVPNGVPQTNEPLAFPLTGRRNMTNDLPALSVGKITVEDGYVIGGNTLTLHDGIDTTGSGNGMTLTFNCGVRLDGNQTFGGYLSLIANGAFDVNGATVTAYYEHLTFNGPVTGTGTINASGVALNADNSFVGDIQTVYELAGSSPGVNTSSISGLTGFGAIGNVRLGGIAPKGPAPSQRATIETRNLILNGTSSSQNPTPSPARVSVTLDPATSDRIDVHGTVALEQMVIFDITTTGPLPIGQLYTIINNDGSDAVSGTFTSMRCPNFCFFDPLGEGATVPAGNQTFRLSYTGGDGNDVTLRAVYPSTTQLTLSPSAPSAGDQVTLTASVTSANGTPSGTVTFADNNNYLAGVPVVNGTASVTTTATAGYHLYTATFDGGTSYTQNTAMVEVTVSAASAATQTTLHDAGPTVYGQPATFTANVTSASGTPTGTVAFNDNGQSMGVATVSGGTATLTTLLDIGSHSITAQYGGDGNDQPSTSAVVTHVVSKAGATLVVTSPAVVIPGETILITATMLPTAPGSGLPGGSVTLAEGSTTLDTSTVVDGSAPLATTLQSIGDHDLNLTYSGDEHFLGATVHQHLTVGRLTGTVAGVTAPEGDEGPHDVSVVLNLSSASNQPLTIAYQTIDGSALAGEDYATALGSITFAPGERSKSFAFTIYGDRKLESDESFTVVFTSPADDVAIPPGTVTIANDDLAYARTSAVPYAQPGGATLTLDLLVPLNMSAAVPAIVAFSTPADEAIVARETTRGYAVVSVAIRSTFPANIDDAKAAIRWLRANGNRYGIDPERIGVWGIGAGGNLAALLGTSGGVASMEDLSEGNGGLSSRVAAVVDWYGETDYVQLATNVPSCGVPGAYVPLFGCSPSTCSDTADAASPMRYASSDDAPLLIMHGISDCVVPMRQSERLRDALRAAGATADLVALNAGHGGTDFASESTLVKVDAFFDRYLRGTSRRRPSAH